MTITQSAKQLVQGALQAGMAKAVALAPDSWIPGGTPDPLIARQHGHIGKPVSRIDGPLKVTGSAPFAAEFAIEGMVYAALAYSTIAKGRIVALDTGPAEAAPGVVGVMTHRNAPRLAPPPVFMSAAKAAGGDDLPVMQDDVIRWNGEPVAVVLAETQEQADHGASLIHADYAAEAALTNFAEAKAKGTRQGAFMGAPLHDETGDAEAALAAAPFKVDATYRTPRHNHNAIELHAVTVAWQGETLRVHDASQLVAHTAWSLAQMFGIEEDKVVVTSPFVGGGFGGKCLWQHQVLAAAAAKLVGRPVRLVLSREGVYRIVGGRSATEQRVALGSGRDGKLTSLIHEGTTAKTAANVMPEPFILATRSAYAAKTMKLDVRTVELDMLANTFMRAPGESVGTFALECAMDELADALGNRPGRAAHPERAGRRPDLEAALLLAQYRAGVARRRRTLRLESAQSISARHPRRRVACRPRLRHGDLPLLPHARRRGTDHSHTPGPCDGRHRGARDGDGHRHRADPDRRGAARTAA